MPKFHALLAGAATLFAAAAGAATPEWRTTTVDLPDGSKAEIKYVGDIPPKVSVTMPVVQDPRSAVVEDLTADMAEEEVDGGVPRARRVIQAPPAPIMPQPVPPQLVVAGEAPKGSTYQYTLITTGADGRVCTQRTEWKSRGRDKAPEVRRSDTGDGCATMSEPPAASAPAHEPLPVDPDAF